MKIKALSVQNLGSVRDVSLSDLPSLAVLVGKNGSGKSFIFNALQLFFDEFSLTGGDSSAKAAVDLWHRRITTNDISIGVELELTEAEFRNLASLCQFTEDETRADVQAGALQLIAVRKLVFSRGWMTQSLQLGSRPLVQEDKVTPAQSPLSVSPPADISQWRLVLFDAASTRAKITGPRLLVNSPAKTAYFTEPKFDELVKTHGLTVTDKYRGQDFNEWVTQQGLTLAERPPEATEAPVLHEALAQVAQATRVRQVAGAFVDAVRASFCFVPAARDARGVSTIRPPLLDQAVADQLRDLPQSRQPADEAKWWSLSRDIESHLSKRLEPHPQEILALDKGLRLPLAQLGSGEQTLVALEWRLFAPASIFAIEDPENHMHPDLAKKTFSLLLERSARLQLLIATHSPFLVDKGTPSTNWRVFIEDQSTHVSRCSTNDDLRGVLLELGVVPSDLQFRDLVVFVEGGTEKEAVFPILADKLGLKIKDNLRVGLISIGGESRLKDNLRIWLEIAQHSPADFRVILDAHAAPIVAELHNEMGIPLEKVKVLSQHAIEDYYPPRLISDALQALYGITVEATELYKKEGISRATTLKRILEENNKIEEGWKVAIGMFVAARMKPSEIPDDLKDAIDLVRTALS